MKKLRLKTISFLTLFSFLLICPFSCSNYTSEDLQTPISCNNFEQYENFEDFVYENVKYNLVHFDPYDFIPVNEKTAYIDEIESLKIQTEGMSIDEMLIYFKNQDKITQSMVDKISYIYNFIDDEFDTGSPDFSIINNELQNLINQEKVQSSVPCITRETNVGVYSSILGLMNYLSEISIVQTPNNSNGQASTRCENIGLAHCAFNGAIWGAIIGGTAGAVLGPLGVGAGIVVGISLGIIAGLAVAVLGGDCANFGCDMDCNPVMGVSLTFPTCTSARYTAFGFGQDVNSTLAWTNVGGTPLTATTTTTVPRTTIMQNSPSVPVVTTITASCTDNGNTAMIIYFTQAMPPCSVKLCHFRRSLTKLHNNYLLMVDIFFR